MYESNSKALDYDRSLIPLYYLFKFAVVTVVESVCQIKIGLCID